MKAEYRIGIVVALFLAVGGLSAWWSKPKTTTNTESATAALNTANTNKVVENTNTSIVVANANTVVNVAVSQTQSAVVVPISGFFGRVTKKPFGIYITPKTSPIQPEKFMGYHTGADAETTKAEAKIDIPIYAVANGTVVLARHVTGYGGVIMIRHVVNKKTVTALYGHLRLSSFQVKVGSKVTKGQKIAVLGTGYSSETDGERKHLHFGILNGSSTNVKGYVSTKSQLSAWLNPVSWLKANGAI